MTEITWIIYGSFSAVLGIGFGYFACLYVNQHVIKAGRDAIAKENKQT